MVQESVYRACEHIHHAFRTGTPAEVAGTDNIKTYALCEAAYVAAETGRTARPEL